MHNYQVPSKYKHITRIGNWSEEWELEETRLKDYLKAKDTGALVSVQKEKNISLSLEPASLSTSEDGLLRFGQNIQLYNEFVDGYLAADISEKIGTFDESFAVTSARGISATVRSVFTIERYEKEQTLYQNDVLHYGQQFRLKANDRLYSKSLYLSSIPANPQRCAKFSRNNEVSVSNKTNADTLWVIEHIDPKTRFESLGQEVRANDTVLIKHVPTSQWLATDNIEYKNQFGTEFEVFGKSYQKHNKTQILIAEKGGKTTIDIPCRNQNNQNTWVFVTAQAGKN